MDYQKIKHTNCGLCDSNNYEEIANKVQFNMPYRTVICKNCGFIYLNPVPIKEELNSFYIHEYQHYYGVPASYGDASFKSRGYEIYNFLKDDVKTAERIVEIGAGGGGNLLGLAEKYNSEELAAFEPGGASNKSLEALGIKSLGEFYDEEPINLKEFELVILSHVLEHFYQPKQILKKLWKETSDNINLYIAIPSLSAINKKTYLYNQRLEDYWLRVVHLSYFHKSNIEDMLNLSGWRVKKIQTKGNGELLILAEKVLINIKENRYRNVYNEHLEEISFYRDKTGFVSDLDVGGSETNNEHIVLFGASNYGANAYERLRDKYEIIFYCDNDPKKWGGKLKGLEIISPKQLTKLNFDFVVITSDYFREIAQQLQNMGIVNFKRFKIN